MCPSPVYHVPASARSPPGCPCRRPATSTSRPGGSDRRHHHHRQPFVLLSHYAIDVHAFTDRAPSLHGPTATPGPGHSSSSHRCNHPYVARRRETWPPSSRLAEVPQRGVVAAQSTNIGSRFLTMCDFSQCVTHWRGSAGLRWSHESVRSLRLSRGSQRCPKRAVS